MQMILTTRLDIRDMASTDTLHLTGKIKKGDKAPGILKTTVTHLSCMTWLLPSVVPRTQFNQPS